MGAAITLLLFGQHSLASDHGPSDQRNVFTRDMRDFSVADQGMVLGLGKRSPSPGNMYPSLSGRALWQRAPSREDTVRPYWSGMVLGLGKRSPGSGNLYQGAPSLEDAGMLMGMGKRASSSMDEPFRPLSNPRWNRHHRIQQKAAETAAEAMKSRREDEMDEMEREGVMQEEEEMVELMEKRSGLTLPTPNVEDAGMLMGMGKRATGTGTGEFAVDGGLSRDGKTQDRTPWQFCGKLFKICPWPELLAERSARYAGKSRKLRRSALPRNRFFQLFKM